MPASFPHLFEPLVLRRHEIRNRILSTGHQTWLAENNRPGDDLIAYHEARARGGVGLIITEAARFHASGVGESKDLTMLDDSVIGSYARLAEAVHRHGAKIFGQISHAGRVTRRMSNGMRGVVWAPSAVPENRFHTLPREMPEEMVRDIVEAAGRAAGRYAEAGYDGVELMASHGLLFAQFLNPAVNQRTDCYGGSADNRLRPLREALIAARRAVGGDVVIGLRISADEDAEGGLDAQTVIDVCQRLSDEGLVDYVNTTLGSMAEPGASIHVVPPMEIAPGYVAARAAAIRSAVGVPVFVAGRINQPQLAEAIIADGKADMCAMTRALITDPDLPRKAKSGRVDDIRACIGCNQACIGHFHAGNPISCIQNPVAGRELRVPAPRNATTPLKVLIAGAGPAGMKAAVTAAELGHCVTLFEAGAQPGGQALLAQMLPERAEFGGLVTNLKSELSRLSVSLRLNTTVDRALIEKERPDAVILATGSTPWVRPLEGGGGDVIQAAELLSGKVKPGSRVVIADWRCDQIGIGIAIRLAREGHHVRLLVAGICAGQNLQQYLRDLWIGRLHDAGVDVIPFARLYGADEDTAWFLHTVTGAAIAVDEVDSLVVVEGNVSNRTLANELADLKTPLLSIGDCMMARSAEEAIYDGLVATTNFLASLAQPEFAGSVNSPRPTP